MFTCVWVTFRTSPRCVVAVMFTWGRSHLMTEGRSEMFPQRVVEPDSLGVWRVGRGQMLHLPKQRQNMLVNRKHS